MTILAITLRKGVVPPATIVAIRDGGFTIESKPPWRMGSRWDLDARVAATGERTRLLIGDTLWRPAEMLKSDAPAHLIAYDTGGFYQTNDDVTVALYRVKGYGYPIVTWWDNKTGKQIA